MKPFLLIMLLIFSLQWIDIPSQEVIPSASSPEKDDTLEQWVASLEPICEFEVTEEYPNVILELFNQLVEQKMRRLQIRISYMQACKMSQFMEHKRNFVLFMLSVVIWNILLLPEALSGNHSVK